MMSSLRRLSKSTVGTIVLILFLLLIVASFAIGDIANVRSGTTGLSSSTLAEVGGEEVTDRELTAELERRLTQIRQQNPTADYSTIAGDFEPILAGLIDQAALSAFAEDNGFLLSKKLIDAQIAQIPGTKGLDGKFSDAAYAAWLSQQRMTDQQVRQIIRAGLLQQMLLQPLAAGVKLPVGIASPYASMLLEGREGDVALIPIAAFAAGLNPTDADIQRFYTQNQARYTVPEQRSLRIARIGPEQVANVAPTEQEIAAYHSANPDIYGTSDVRVISQAVVPDQNSAQAIATRARAGGTLAAAAAPAGLSAEDVSVGPQKRQEFTSLAGEKVAAAGFAAKSGEVVGPVQSDLGWHVVKVESVQTTAGKSLAEARPEIVAKLTADKRKEAIEALIEKIQQSIEDGANFQEAAAASNIAISQTPLLMANGTSRQNPDFRLPPELAPALRSGFELEANEEPMIETLEGDAGYALVAPANIIPAAPAPLDQVRAQVAQDWVQQQASARARAVATGIEAKVAKGMSLADAVKQAGTPLPAPRGISARRMDLTTSQQPVPEPIRIMFNLAAGKTRTVADRESNALAVVRLNRIVPGNAAVAPGLVAQVQRDFTQPVAQEYASQFLSAIRSGYGVKRNADAIEATRKRIFAR